MPSPTDFNLSPYFDDYAESKKFHRVLFRPSNAVQARELTQSQSILQNQIERVSDFLFQKGAMVIPGEIGFDLNYSAVKLTSKTFSSISDYIGKKLTGVSSGVIGICVDAIASDGTDPDTLYIKYNKTGTNNIALVFTNGETIQASTVTSATVLATAVVNSTATGSAASINSGVYYINGYQVSVLEQTIVLDKYTNTPSYRIGLTITESFVSSNEDSSLNDNAQGSSNINAPGAHRFKIDLTLAKRTLTSTDDQNFVELLRLSSGIRQNKINSTPYSVFEDTLARRTFDESGDYVIKDYDLDIREQYNDGTNRGIYTQAQGGNTNYSLLTALISQGKSYVKGYEIQSVGPSYIDIPKARDIGTANNSQINYTIGNFVNVKNVFGTPDIGFISGAVEAFKKVNLYNIATISRGTEQSTLGVTVPQIGIAKSRGFELNNGTSTAGAFSTSALTSSVYKHYLFDIEFYTHLNVKTAPSFTNGEKVTGGTSGAYGYVQTITSTKSATITGATAANPCVVTANAHTFKEGQQVTITGVVGMTQLNSNVYTVRNPATNTFELYATDGITKVNSTGYTGYSSAGAATHGVIVLNNVTGKFTTGETITGAVSSVTASIQSDAVGFKGVQTFDFTQVKQIGMAGSPTYTADTALDISYGALKKIEGQISIANSSNSIQGFGTLFTKDLVIDDSITFINDAGVSVTRIIRAIISDTSLTLTAAVGGSDVSTKSTAYLGYSVIKESNNNISIFKLPYDVIDTLSDINFNVRRQFTAPLSGGSATITAGTNEIFTAIVEKDYDVSIMTIGSATAGAVGDVLAVTGNNYAGAQIATLAGTPTGKTLTLNYGANYANATIKILATVFRDTVTQKTKTNTAGTITITSQAVATAAAISLGKADIISISAIYMSGDFSTTPTNASTNVTDRFNLDNGQRDNFYDLGRITLKTGAIQVTGRLLINFTYWAQGSGDFFSVDSYPSDVNTYENLISTYKSDTTGTNYKLRDCLDFRPRVADDSTINGSAVDRVFQTSNSAIGTGSLVDVIQFNSGVRQDVQYYLPRIDKIFLDKDGRFKTVQGNSSLSPQVPKGLDSAMHLYTVYLNAYTFGTSDLVIKKVDNKRYTMRDIGRLENRISNVEYYTQLSLLETQTQSLQIQDSNGFDRYKNGFFVDNFTGHGIGDPTNLDYKVAMDMAQGNMRPTCNSDSIDFIEKNTTNSARAINSYQRTGSLITLPYTETTSISQPYASHYENVNPFNIFTWSGSVVLDPPGDTWKETNRVPDLLVNEQGSFDTMAASLGNPNLIDVELSTVWNEWQDFWAGTPAESTTTSGGRDSGGGGRRAIVQDVTTTTAQQIAQTRTGIRTAIVPQIVQTSLGDRVLSLAFIPFIRSRTINFTATRMKPNTRVYAYFDNVLVHTYVTPTGGSLGGNLITNANGACSGTFTIPDATVDANPRWRTGTRVFRLTSASTNSQVSVETSAEGDYTASGAIETVQNTIVSTRVASTVRQTVTDNQNIVRTSTRTTTEVIGWIDPIAQTFLVDDSGGIFTTSVDLFFSSKDANIPVTLQIREVVNGYPSRTLVPFGEVTLNPSSVNISDDASLVTTFTFPSPVYLQEKTEYCFAVLSNSNDYNVWAATIGETQLNSNRKISTNPYAGVFFKSQNGSTWTADQTTDIKFNLKRAKFSNVTGSVDLVNDVVPATILPINPIRTTNASGVVRVFHRNHGLHTGTDYVTISGIAAGTYNGITSANLNGTFTNLTNITLDSYDITTIGTATATGDVGGSTVSVLGNRIMDLGNINLSILTVSGTSINYNLTTVTGKSIHGSETPYVSSGETAVHIGDNIYFTAPQIIASSINETQKLSGNKSLLLNVKLYTTAIDADGTSHLSPVIDITRASIVAVQNRLNNPTSGNTPNFVADTAPYGSSSAAIYVSRPVNLTNTSTALDIRLTSNVRSSSTVKVFYRLSSSAEVRDITNISWTPFNTDGSEDSLITPASNSTYFTEYKYSVSGLDEFIAFQIKIILKGTNSSYPPIIQDLRGIALAI